MNFGLTLAPCNNYTTVLNNVTVPKTIEFQVTCPAPLVIPNDPDTPTRVAGGSCAVNTQTETYTAVRSHTSTYAFIVIYILLVFSIHFPAFGFPSVNFEDGIDFLLV